MLKILYQVTSATMPSLLHLVGDADAILFRQDACYLLQSASQWPTTQLYVLAADANFRQVDVPANVQAIDDITWVSLCAAANKVITC